MKLKMTLTAAVIAVAALAGTVAQAAPNNAPANQDAPEKSTAEMKYYQHKDAAAPGKAGAGVAPKSAAPGRSAPQGVAPRGSAGVAPQGSAGVAPRGSGGIAPKHLDRQVWPPSYDHGYYSEVLYQEEATVFGNRDRWSQRFNQHTVVIDRRGNVFEGYVVKQYGWRQHTAPLFRITTDMIYGGYVYYGQPYSYRTGPYTLTVQLGDLILRGDRLQGMNFLVTLEREYSRYTNYYGAPGYSAPGYPHSGYGRSAPGVTPMDAPGRAGAKTEPKAAGPGKTQAGKAQSGATPRGEAVKKDEATEF
jgi:hypothetical protein